MPKLPAPEEPTAADHELVGQVVDHDHETRPNHGRLQEVVTQVGAMVGTLAYMAPEQISGKLGDGRTDQFSFCVMLWEALYGERPFFGNSMASLAGNILEGKFRARQKGTS